jgi:Major intrinsic protein
MWAGDTPALVPLQAAFAHFCLLLILVSATQPISGGHFNPMVSVVMAWWGELRASRLPWYVVRMQPLQYFAPLSVLYRRSCRRVGCPCQTAHDVLPVMSGGQSDCMHFNTSGQHAAA